MYSRYRPLRNRVNRGGTSVIMGRYASGSGGTSVVIIDSQSVNWYAVGGPRSVNRTHMRSPRTCSLSSSMGERSVRAGSSSRRKNREAWAQLCQSALYSFCVACACPLSPLCLVSLHRMSRPQLSSGRCLLSTCTLPGRCVKRGPRSLYQLPTRQE